MTGGYHIRGEHLKLIATGHVRNSLRSGAGVIFLVMSMIVGIALAAFAIMPVEVLQKEADKLGEGERAAQAFNKIVEDYGPRVLDWFTDVGGTQSEYLLRDKPAVVTLFIVLMIAFLPFLANLSGFNQTSGDIGSKGLRYLLLRTERPNIFLGRLIGTYLFTLVVIAIIFAVVALYLLIKIKFYPAADVLIWLLHGLAASAIFVLPWVAFCAWISALIEIPFLSLVICELGILFWVILVAIARARIDEAGYAALATPWGWKWWLVHPSIGRILIGVVVMLAFTALFTWMGLRTFQRRDM